MKLEDIRKLWGPHKRYPIYFADYPDANQLLDLIPKLLAVAEAAKARHAGEKGNPLADALAALEAP